MELVKQLSMSSHASHTLHGMSTFGAIFSVWPIDFSSLTKDRMLKQATQAELDICSGLNWRVVMV